MAISKQVVPGLFVIPTGIVSTFLIDAPRRCILGDASCPAAGPTSSAGSRSAGAILTNGPSFKQGVE